MRQQRLLLALGAALSLSACISFGAKPPPRLLTLTATQTLPANASRTGSAERAISVLVPTAPQELNTLRVPVRTGATEVAYLKDAQWVEMPAHLFQRLLGDTIAATTGRVVLDPRQASFDPGVRLSGQLRSFGLDAGRMEVVAVYDAALARAPNQVETRRFEVRVPVAAADVAAVGPALNDAANQIAAQVATWIGG